MSTPFRILLLEDSANDAELIQNELSSEEFDSLVKWVMTKAAFVKELKDFAPDLVLSDYLLPEFNGLTALRLAKEISPLIPFIIVTGSINEETAVECMKAGASDYVLKDHLSRVIPAIQNAIDKKRIRDEKARTELALRESETRIRAIMDAALDAIITIDQKGRITEFNPAAETVFGHTRDEALGQPMADLIIPPGLRERHGRGFEHYLVTGEGPIMNRRIEMTALRKDGTEFPAELAITRITREGPPMFAGFIRDITERKRAEGERERLISELKEALADVKTLSGLLPICACCKKVRDDTGYWHQVESYFTDRSDISFSHGYCPECAARLYPEYYQKPSPPTT